MKILGRGKGGADENSRIKNLPLSGKKTPHQRLKLKSGCLKAQLMASYSACVINTVVVVDVLLLLMVMLFLLVIVVEYWWYGRLKAWLWRATNDLPLWLWWWDHGGTGK